MRRIEPKAEIAADLVEPHDGAPPVEHAEPARLADQQVLQHAEARRQVKMLMHHADAVGERIGRIADPDRFAVEQNHARVGLVGAEQDVHQGGLAGAVLAEQSQNVARPDDEVDAVVGANGAERLGDAAHVEKRN